MIKKIKEIWIFKKHVKREFAEGADERGINVKFILSALFKCILPNNNNNQNNKKKETLKTKSLKQNNNQKISFPVED